MVAVADAGGSMEDQLRVMGEISPSARVVGGRGQTDAQFLNDYSHLIERKKWWQFWK
jgi:hypothetical protein